MPDLLSAPQRGDSCPAFWQATGYALAPPLNIHDDTLDIEALMIEVTNTGSGGVTSRLGGKLDASATVNSEFDLNAQPYLAPFYLLPGLSGIYGKTVAPLGPRVIQVPTIISKTHYQSAIDTDVKQSFDVKCNARAGYIIFPTS